MDQFPALLARLPAGLDVDALARETKAFRRPRGVRSAVDLLRLVLAWAASGWSLQHLAAWAGEQGIARLTDEALIQRLHGAVGFLQALVGQLLCRGAQPPCWHGRVVRIADSTSLSKPASKGTDWRVHAVYDLGQGGFSHLELTDGHGAEALDRGPAVAGELRIADRGYANAQSWQRFLSAGQGASDLIVRMRWNTIRLVDDAGQLFDLIGWLRTRPAEQEVHEIVVFAQSGRRQKPIEIRLVVRRKSPQAIAATLKLLHQRASRKQTRINPHSLVAAEFLILATTLPAAQCPAGDVLAVYRLRWQIELAFKRLKSLLHIDDIPTRTKAGTQCWLYAKLLLALLCDDLNQDVLESFPSGAF